MLSRSDTHEIYALQPDGNWLLYRDSWQKGEALGDGTPPPPGVLAPIHGFGKLWLEEPELRQSFGWATAPEQSLTGGVQEFTGGEMIDTSDHVIYVLYQDGTWQSFPDPYPTPTATPSTVSP